MEVAVAAYHRDLLHVEVDPLHLAVTAQLDGRRIWARSAVTAVARLDLAGADLGEQRREEGEVLAADDPDLDVVAAPGQPLEVLRRLHAREAAAEDEDPVRPGRLGPVDRAHVSRSCHG